MTVKEASKYTPEEYEKYATWHWLPINPETGDAHLWRSLGNEVVYMGNVLELAKTGELPEQVPLIPTLP